MTEFPDFGWIKAENWFHAVTVYIQNTNNLLKYKNKTGKFYIIVIDLVRC